ncbi:MAG: hypothetical protein AAGN64_00245 [Bacteroidota bacterium]
MQETDQERTERLVKWQADRRMRWAMLHVLYGRRGNDTGWTGGLTIRDEISGMPGFDLKDDQHCVDLLRDLRIKGMVRERDTRRFENDRFCLEFLAYRLRPRGLSLYLQTIEPDPDVDDPRRV